MAYTAPNTRIIKARSRRRYIHRQMRLTVGGTGKGGGATTAASDQLLLPGPARLIAVQYGGPNATESMTVGAVLTSGALLIKADTTAGATIYGDSDLSSVTTAPVPVGTTALDEGGAATAATDGFSGGFPVRQGVFASITSGTDTEILVLDLWFRLCTYIEMDLVAQSGADGSGVVTRQVDLNGPGVLAAVAVDYQNEPSTTDILIKADTTNGATLFTRTSSLTDLGPTLVGSPAADEGGAAAAATDGTECGAAFKRGLFFDIAQANAFTSSDERIIIECWIDD